ncbi:MAG: hypothetical protein AAFR81_29065 [Chloroflexota bacterium]
MQVVRNALTQDKTRIIRRGADKALLVLVGLSSELANWNTIAQCFDSLDMDIFVPDYVARPSLAGCVESVADFIITENLASYQELHVFAYILGGAIFNRYLAENDLPNLRSIIYDRSPHQERAPRVAADLFPSLARLSFGNVVLELADNPYQPCPREDIHRALLIETKRTTLMQIFAWHARKMGAIHWEANTFGQAHDDYVYIPLDHTQMYARLGAFSSLLSHFYAHGHFPENANRTPPQE